MASVKGIIVEIGGDTSGLQKALSKVNSSTVSLSKELKGVNSLLKLDPKNTELVSQKQEVLKENIEQTASKLEQLKKTQELADDAIRSGAEISEGNQRNLQREIINTENKLKQLKLEASNWTTAGRSIEEFGNKVKNISEKIDNMGTTITTRLTLPITAIATASVKTGNEFEAQMSRVKAIAGATNQELENLTDQAIELGSKTSFSASEVAAGMENLASAGFTTNEIMSAMPGLLDLAASSGAELATSSEITASVIRGFGLEANSAAHIADVFAEASARTNAQTEDMGEAMKYVAPVAKTVGLTIEETAAAIGIMSDAGVKGSQAGTSLRAGLSRIVKPTKQAKEAMETLGVEFYDNNGKMKSLSEIVQILQEKTKGLTDETKNQALAQIFGTDALSGMLALINRGSDELSDMTKSFEKCDGAASEMAETMLDNTSGALESLSGSFESAGIVIQKALSPNIKKLAKWIQGLVDSFTELSDEEQQNIVNNTLLVASIGPAIKILGTLGKGIGNTAKGIGTFSQAIGVMKTGMQSTNTSANNLAKAIGAITNPTGLATTAIIALTAAVVAHGIKSYKEMTSLNGVADSLNNQKEKWKELQQTREETIDANSSEIVSTQKLASELNTIVEENGKIKQGYENRANYIVNELNKALGTEYSINGDIIEQYQTMQDDIQKLIEKKKAETLLNAYQEEYAEALKMQSEATENLISLRQQLADAQERIHSTSGMERIETEQNIRVITKALQDQVEIIDKCGYTIQNYENLQTASVSNSSDEINKAVDQMGISWDRAKEQCEQSISQQVSSQAIYVQELKKALQNAKDMNDEYQQYILKGQLETAEKQLDALVSTMTEQTSTVENLSQNEIDAWGNVANSSYVRYMNNLSKLPIETQEEINKTTDVVKYNTSLSNATQELAKDVNTEFNKNVDGQKWGSDLTGNISSGMTSSKSKHSISNAAKTVGEWISSFLHHSTPDKGPLKNDDVWMSHMINNFVKDINKNKSKVTKSAENLAKELNIPLENYEMSIPQIKDFGNLQGALSAQIVDSTKTIFTTPQIVFNVQELDEARLQQCFNYINKKYGSAY